MKLALIPPVSRLSDMFHSEYQLGLAHLINDPNPLFDSYRGAFRMAQERGNYVILDNGAYEGSLVTAKVLTDLANSFIPNEIVIPDSYRNEGMTQAMAEQYYNDYRPWLNPDVGLMFVAQGTSSFEVENSIEWAMQQDWIKTIALPRHLIETCEYKEVRLILAEHIRDRSQKEVHFLGASPLWTYEIVAARNSGIVRGMDTSMPYVYGFSYERWPSTEVIDSAQSRSFYFALEADQEQNQIITSNVKGMIDCVNEL